VLDTAGYPVPGVVIAARRTNPSLRPLQSIEATRLQPTSLSLPAVPESADVPERSTRSGLDGSFSWAGLDAGVDWRFWVPGDKYWLTTSDSEPVRVGITGWVFLRAAPAREVSGRVVDAQGRPVVAHVRLESTVAIPDDASVGFRDEYVATDAEGRFVVRAAGTGRGVLEVLQPGAARWILPVELRETLPSLEVRLPEMTASVVATVVTVRGAVVPGARVEVRAKTDGPDAVRVVRDGLADAEGVVRLGGFPAGSIEAASVSADGKVARSSAQDAVRGTTLSVGRETSLEMLLLEGSVVHGVVRASDGTPLAGARVALYAETDSTAYAPWSEAETASDGAYRVEQVPPGQGVVYARAPGSSIDLLALGPALEGDRGAWDGVPFHVDDDASTVRLDVTLARAATLRGRAVNPRGEPVPGAVVEIRSATGDDRPEKNLVGEIVTDSDGRFVATEIPRPGEYVLKARRHTSWSASVTVAVATDAETVALEVVLQQGAVVEGTYRGPDGTPVRGTPVYGGGAEAVTDTEGRFRMEGVEPGTERIDTPGGHREAPSDDKAILVAPDGSPTRVTIVPDRPSGPAAAGVRGIRGTVIDSRGEAVPGAHVEARRTLRVESWGGTSTTADAQGAFTLEGLRPEPFRLTVNGEEVPGTFRPDADPVRLVVGLDPPGGGAARWTVEGTVLLADGRPASGGRFHVRPRGIDNNWLDAAVGRYAEGKFSVVARGWGGKFHVVVVPDHDRLGRPRNLKPVASLPWEPSSPPLAFRLEPGREVRGRIVDETGLGVPGLAVTARQGDSEVGTSTWGSARTDADGSFRVFALPTGDVTLECRVVAPFCAIRPRPLKADESSVLLHLRRGLSISGIVVDPSGRPIPGQTIVLSETDSSKARRGRDRNTEDQRPEVNWISADTGADGSFRVRGLPFDGRFDVQAAKSYASDRPLFDARVADVPSGTSDLRLVMEEGVWLEGVVVDPTGTPVASVSVQAEIPGEEESWDSHRRADSRAADGRFRMGPLRPGTYVVSARGSGRYGPGAPQSIDVPSAPIRLDVPIVATVFGTVEGAPGDRFELTLFSSGKDRSATAYVADDGAFAFDAVPDEPRTLCARSDGDVRFALREGVRPGHEPLRLVLEVGQSIEGRIEGLPAPQKEAQAWNVLRFTKGVLAFSVRVADDGGFRITGLPPGEYSVEGEFEQGEVKGVMVAGVPIPAGTAGVVLQFRATEK
jgi:protocatechuate 3,4-dioxygenase beta subunit